MSKGGREHVNLPRSPNHMCASSCVVVRVTPRWLELELKFASYNTLVSRKVIRPQFSIAPDTKSGIAIRSENTSHEVSYLLLDFKQKQ